MFFFARVPGGDCATPPEPKQLIPEEELVGRTRHLRQEPRGTLAILCELQDPERQLPFFWLRHQFQLDQEKCAGHFRVAPRGSAAGLAGDINELFKVLLDDEEATLLVRGFSQTEGNDGGAPHQPRFGVTASVSQAVLRQGFHVSVDPSGTTIRETP